jgi:Type II secretion system (T2SS), protein L
MSKKASKHCVIIIDTEPQDQQLVASAFISIKQDITVFPKQLLSALVAQAEVIDFFATDAKQRHLTLIIPSEHISCMHTRLHAKQAAFADKIIGSVIEEKLAHDLEQLHVNLLHVSDSNIAYAVTVSRSYMKHIYNALPDQVAVDAVIPDGFCLPVSDNAVRVALIRDRIIVRCGLYDAAAYPFTSLDAVAHSLATSLEGQQTVIVHHAADALAQVFALQKILTQANESINLSTKQIEQPSLHSYVQHLYLAQLQQEALMPNIMQPFKSSASSADNITMAKRVAAGLGFIAIVDLIAITLASIILLGFAWLLGVGSQSIVDKVNPDITYETLIDGAGQGQNQSFTQMLSSSLALYPKEEGKKTQISVNYIRYIADSNELALRMAVPNFSVLQEYKIALEAAGYIAEVSANASPNNGQLIASVRISTEGY